MTRFANDSLLTIFIVLIHTPEEEKARASPQRILSLIPQIHHPTILPNTVHPSGRKGRVLDDRDLRFSVRPRVGGS